MDPYIKITKTLTNKLGSKVINRQYVHRKTGLQAFGLVRKKTKYWLSRLPMSQKLRRTVIKKVSWMFRIMYKHFYHRDTFI